MHRIGRFVPLAILALVLALVAAPATSVPKPAKVNPALLKHLSQPLEGRQQAAERLARLGEVRRQGAPFGDRFNRDSVGLPQNEESVTVCRNRPNIVVGGTNDYRGLLDPQGNFTGWYFSTNGGRSVAKEGLLPPVRANGQVLPSGGDPVSQSDDRCRIYAADLNYGPTPFEEGRNAIGVYRTTPEILARCPAGEDPDQLTQPACWPVRRAVAFADVVGGVGQFLDKPWMDVGQSGSAGEVVWVVYADFAIQASAPLGFTGAQIKAVRCDADLRNCTQPILISGTDQDIQNADVTIGEDGRTLITWVQIQGELEQTAQTFTVKARIAPAGSTNFGPTRVVARETNPLPFGGFLHANDFRISTYPKSIMPLVGGRARLYVTWDRCRFRLLDNVCEEPEILLSHSDNDGRTWSTPQTISAGGDNYFPAISDEVGSPNFVIAYYTNRFDPIFHNRQDVELVTIAGASGRVINRQRVTKTSNETEADPILGGLFIGDYFDVHLLGGTAYVHYNANVRHVRVLGQGFPVPQQDNFLTKIGS
jgi:hypothetical protein